MKVQNSKKKKPKEGAIKSEENKNIVGWAAVFLATQQTFAKDVGLTIELLAQSSNSLLHTAA